jgi:hypothetical protein
MDTPEQREEQPNLSAKLQSIGQRYFSELPHATASLVLTVNEGHVLVEAYDRMGRKLGDIPNQWTSSGFVSDLQDAFAEVVLPSGENVNATISNPLRRSANS